MTLLEETAREPVAPLYSKNIKHSKRRILLCNEHRRVGIMSDDESSGGEYLLFSEQSDDGNTEYEDAGDDVVTAMSGKRRLRAMAFLYFLATLLGQQ